MRQVSQKVGGEECYENTGANHFLRFLGSGWLGDALQVKINLLRFHFLLFKRVQGLAVSLDS